MTPELARLLSSQTLAEGLAHLVTIYGDDLPSPIRLSTGGTVTAGGQVYRAYPVEVVGPEVASGDVRPGQLRLWADRELVDLVRSLRSPLRVDVRLAVGQPPVYVQDLWLGGLVQQPRLEQGELVCDVHWPAWTRAKVPPRRYTPTRWPGLFPG